jgi:hypothetical protein
VLLSRRDTMFSKAAPASRSYNPRNMQFKRIILYSHIAALNLTNHHRTFPNDIK